MRSRAARHAEHTLARTTSRPGRLSGPFGRTEAAPRGAETPRGASPHHLSKQGVAMGQSMFPVNPRSIPNGTPPLDRIAMRLVIEPSGCWTLTGRTSNTGYHTIGISGVTHNAHRWLFKET